jgi:hypothetical protein
LAAAALVALAAPAAGAAPTRPEFVAQAEAICKATNKSFGMQLKKLVKPLKGQGDFPPKNAKELSKRQLRNKLRVFLRFFGETFVIQGRAIHSIDRQLAPIPEPPGDEPAIAQWIESRRANAEQLKEMGKSLKSMRRPTPKRFLGVLFQSFGLVDKFLVTDQIVAPFGFDQCLLAKGEEPTL